MTVAHTIAARAAARARYPGANPHSVVHGNQRGANRTPFGARDDTRPRRHPPLLASVRSSDLRRTLKMYDPYEAHTHQPAPPEASRASALPKQPIRTHCPTPSQTCTPTPKLASATGTYPNAVPQPCTVHLLIAGAEGVIVSILC
ncbi:hypothetical protein C8J57DRAFT_1247384 [Mycena rebaudengoi]|nr:hypothetical protein C8J57DRAFT_1247384 [Mycena rebaudengoi]